MSTKFWGRSLRQLSDFDKHQPKFIVMYDETFSYMGADYLVRAESPVLPP